MRAALEGSSMPVMSLVLIRSCYMTRYSSIVGGFASGYRRKRRLLLRLVSVEEAAGGAELVDHGRRLGLAGVGGG